ncbi:hypothetical protein [Actinophytocola sp. NPDC049390]|uniref:hypothetical protein n=1 Tax=Actinophytocola sp. NPDC049390 TaxID=3363894 RepID=UPI00378EFD02
MTAKGAPTEPAGQQTSARAEPKRINVAVSPDTVRALENVIEREGVTLTEALRRLIGYGDFVYRAVRENREQLIVKGDEGSREVVLL